MNLLRIALALAALAVAAPAADTVNEKVAEVTAVTEAVSAERTVTAGRLAFSFVETPWLDVLEWYADESSLNLDWQHLPDGKLNLITHRGYSIDEARDVINRHLLARGFTLLRTDESLFLAKLDAALNPTMVPRVQVGELKSQRAHDFVRVVFSLDWMLAEKAAEELKPLLSPHGRIVPMKATNRIDVMDAVANLREVERVLSNEQSNRGQEQLVVEFPLQHAIATEVIQQLQALLGLEVTLDKMSREQMRTAREQYEFRAELVKRLGDKAPKMKKERPEIYLVANERKNSILANAPPDKIATIRQAVQSLDVPTGQTEAPLSDVTTMKVYPMNGVEADALQEILNDLREIGKIHPNARFSDDDDREILFVYASLQDHLTIKSVLDQLVTSSRSFRVIPLARLRASYVAESIQSLMGGPSGDDRRRRGSASRWRGFRVEADEANNRLFLLATESELREVEKLMVKIGERKASSGQVRVLSVDPEEAQRVLEQIERGWSDGPLKNRLEIQVPGYDTSPQSGAARNGAGPLPAADGSAEGFPETIDRGALTRAIATRRAGAEEEVEFAPPVEIRRGAAGTLELRSFDVAALDEVEGMFSKLLPAGRPHKTFQLEHASPYSMEMTIQEILTEGSMTLTTPLKFVSDSNTKSLMVFNATTSELARISDIVEMYDKPTVVDPELVRTPRFFPLEFARADAVAQVIKDIYRDVLSPEDQALARRKRGQSDEEDRVRPPASYFAPAYFGESKRPQFKGMLSIGTYPDTNTIVVSAPEYLTEEIAQTIRGLDQPTASSVARVVRIDGAVSAPFVVEKLLGALEAGAGSNPAASTSRPGNARDGRRSSSDTGRAGRSR